jgi:predicted acyl esterase
MLASDAQPMPADEFVPVTIPLYFQGHGYRAGSQIRVTISAPNGTQPIWSFDETQPPGTTSQVSVASSPTMPSRLVLPVVPLTTIGSAQPACPSLRNEPCRPAVAFTNQTH